MAASLGDLIQIIDNQDYFGEAMMNVYYYRVTSITGLSGDYLEAIVDEFHADVVEAVKGIQNNSVTHTTISARNLSNNLDVYDKIVNEVGDLTSAAGVPLPGWVTVNFKLVRESLATRNGSKRYTGLVEPNSSGNVYNMGSTEQTAIQNALAADIVIGVATIAEPVIVQRPIVPPVGTGYTYSSIGSAVYTTYGTQNTRKP